MLLSSTITPHVELFGLAATRQLKQAVVIEEGESATESQAYRPLALELKQSFQKVVT
jgi:hypothetical protein